MAVGMYARYLDNLQQGREPGDGVQKAGLIGAAVGVAGAAVEATAVGQGVASAGVRTSGAATARRYMGGQEAATVARTGVIPNRYLSNEPRLIHYTTDNATASASGAMARYGLNVEPTHMVEFSGADVANSVSPMGKVASDATQGATSRPIPVSGPPIRLDQ